MKDWAMSSSDIQDWEDRMNGEMFCGLSEEEMAEIEARPKIPPPPVEPDNYGVC